MKKGTKQQKIIGSIHRYVGTDPTEHPYLAHHEVKIVAVLKGAADLDHDPDDEVAAHITDDDALAAAGGVTAADRLEDRKSVV